MTPSVAIVRIETPHWHTPRLWIPVFLLWVPALLLAPVIVLALAGVRIAGGVSLWRAIAAFWSLLCSLPGTRVCVCADGNSVQVRIL